MHSNKTDLTIQDNVRLRNPTIIWKAVKSMNQSINSVTTNISKLVFRGVI